MWKITTERRNKSKWDYFFPLRSQVCTNTHGVSMQQNLPGKCPDLLQTPGTLRESRREKSPCCWKPKSEVELKNHNKQQTQTRKGVGNLKPKALITTHTPAG